MTRIIQRTALLALLLSLLLAGCGAPYAFNGTLYDPAIPAPEIAGLNPDGSPFSMQALQGNVVLLFFGYTSCPDICPLALSDLQAVKTALGDEARDLAVVYVSVDPERDTPERLGDYIKAFDPEFYSVHVPLDALPEVKQGYGVYAEKRALDAGQSAAGYLVDHSGWTYLIDKPGNLRAVFGTDTPVEAMVEDTRYLLGRR